LLELRPPLRVSRIAHPKQYSREVAGWGSGAVDHEHKNKTPGLSGFDIVCVGCVEWLVIHSVAEYTMLGFAQSNRVLFVEPFGSWITLTRMARWQKRNRAPRPRLEQVSDRRTRAD
jgi:hypothetical protein